MNHQIQPLMPVRAKENPSRHAWNHRSFPRTAALAVALAVWLAAPLCTQGQVQPPSAATSGTEPVWSGDLKVAGTELPLVFRFVEKDGKTNVMFRSPKQMPSEIPATAKLTGTMLVLAVPSAQARFEGKVGEDGASAEGHWIQGGQKFPLLMRKAFQKRVEVSRPQTPKPPFPYKTEEVVFENATAGVKLAGTLSLPRGNGPHQAVILISGSGQQDRDETLFDHKPFLLIADHLTRAGIAVLRYDDRGAGKSTGADKLENATSADFAGDAAAAFDFLIKRPDINSARVALLGHSEGGIIAPMVAGNRPAVAALVHLAGPTLSGAEVLRHQFIHNLRELPENQRGLAGAFLEKLIDALKSAETGNANPRLLKRLFDEHVAGLPETDREKFMALQTYITKTAQIAVVPWTHYFIKYDPAPSLKAVRCPLLALFGGKDVQIVAETNAARLRQLLPESKNVTIRTFSGLNHLFQTAKTGEGAEYAEIEQTMSPEVLSAIEEFLKGLP